MEAKYYDQPDKLDTAKKILSSEVRCAGAT